MVSEQNKKVRLITMKTTKKKQIVILALSIVLLAAAAVYTVLYIMSSIRYDKAEVLLADGLYREALEAFTEIKNFRDSGEKIEKLEKYQIPYDDAEKLFANGEFERAAEEFEKLGDYEDSPERVLAATYAIADNHFQNAEYEAAIAIFEKLGDYKDSGERVLESTYAIAERHFQNADYEKAENIFRSLVEKKYSDSENRLDETLRHIRYNGAVAELGRQNLAKAYEEFVSLGDFLDCMEKLAEIDEAYWEQTLAQNTMAGYETYLKFPGANHKSEAQANHELLYAAEQTAKATLELEAALEKNTVPALDSFADAWENSPYAEELLKRCGERIKNLQNDGSLSSPILSDISNATQAMIDAFLADYPGHRDEAKIRALIEGDIFALIQSGTIAIFVTGDTIDFTTARLVNKSRWNITVTIPLGTYFAANNSGVQDMVVREAKTVKVWANDSTSVSLKSACMNIAKAIPTPDNGFAIHALETNSKLKQVLTLLEETNAPYNVAQAAVWIVTDNPGDDELLNTLVHSNGERAIGPEDLAKAREIVKSAG